jgi:hypothetical protein
MLLARPGNRDISDAECRELPRLLETQRTAGGTTGIRLLTNQRLSVNSSTAHHCSLLPTRIISVPMQDAIVYNSKWCSRLPSRLPSRRTLFTY